MSSHPIIVAGAGPTGLALALSLARHGAPVRIIDQHDGPGQASRAMVVHARNLEFYDQFGFAAEKHIERAAERDFRLVIARTEYVATDDRIVVSVSRRMVEYALENDGGISDE